MYNKIKVKNNGNKCLIIIVVIQWSEPWRLHNIAGNKPKDNHNPINKILHGRSTIFLATEGGEYKEDSKPNNKFIFSKHSK